MERVRTAVSAEAFTAVVSAYADRVHDDVRRLGCSAAQAVDVVERSAHALLDRVRTAPEQVGDLVGAWFREARGLARRIATDAEAPDSARTGAIVGKSDDDSRAREALAALSEQDRTALLLRDSYDLPYAAVAVALAVDEAAAPAVVGAARLRFTAHLAGASEPAGPDRFLGDVAQQVDGQLAAKRAHALRDHLGSCPACTAAEPAMRDARRLLSGLAIIAMPDTDRDRLIVRAARAAERDLPSAEQVAAALDAASSPLGISPSLVASCLAGALILGALTGVVTSGGPTTQAAGPGSDVTDSESPSPSASASPSPSPSPSGTGSPTALPSPTATTTASPTPSATGSPTATRPPWRGRETLTLDPAGGPNCSSPITVRGTYWYPGVRVRITYRDLVGRQLGSASYATPDATGRFRVEIVPCDNNRIPGPHVVRAENGEQSRETTYTASP